MGVSLCTIYERSVMNHDNKKSRSNSGRITAALGKAFVALATLAVFVPLSGSQAGESRENGPSAPAFIVASGPWVDCNVVTDLKQVGRNLVITVDITETFSGTLDGCYTGTERDVVYRNGSATFHGSGIFTGVVNGQSGTMVMIYEGTANAQGVASASWVLEQGTGGLTNLHGKGTFEGTLVALQTSPCTPPDPTVCDGGMFGGTV
ncbi:MAG: hypothetical protein DME65_00580 [Verrucomicrobia bacterium]|nr:MAG: hypothetical protein DME65_00580 [Verrucomicrobiota bacterium]